MREVYQEMHAHGALCIADEVQCGFGRLGDHFWAFEQQGVVPDIVALGKPIANGFPMGALVGPPPPRLPHASLYPLVRVGTGKEDLTNACYRQDCTAITDWSASSVDLDMGNQSWCVVAVLVQWQVGIGLCRAGKAGSGNTTRLV